MQINQVSEDDDILYKYKHNILVEYTNKSSSLSSDRTLDNNCVSVFGNNCFITKSNYLATLKRPNTKENLQNNYQTLDKLDSDEVTIQKQQHDCFDISLKWQLGMMFSSILVR